MWSLPWNMFQNGFQVPVLKGWQRSGDVLLWPCEIFLMKMQNKKLYDFFFVFVLFLIHSVVNKFCVEKRNCQTVILHVQSAKGRWSTGCGSTGRRYQIGSCHDVCRFVLSNQTSMTIYGLISNVQPGPTQWVEKKRYPETTISSRLSHCVDNGGSGKLHFGFTQSSRGS